MAKQSGYLMRLQAQKAAEVRYRQEFTVQWCADAAALAAHEVFHRKGDKLAEFMEAFVRYSHEIAELTIEDSQNDKEISYAKGTIDAALKEALGDHFLPWAERYGKKYASICR